MGMTKGLEALRGVLHSPDTPLGGTAECGLLCLYSKERAQFGSEIYSFLGFIVFERGGTNEEATRRIALLHFIKGEDHETTGH